MTRAEWSWCLRYGVLLAMLTTLPYAVAFAAQGDEWGFTGSVFGVEDGNSYIAKMRMGASGDWLFRTPYSSRPQSGIPAFLPYLILGKLAGRAPSHQTLVILYHLLRASAVPLAAAATYRFLAESVESVRWRRWGTVLGTLGGGLGWVLLIVQPGVVPPEFYSPEAFGFLALFGIPHLALARGVLLLGICWQLQAARQGSWGWQAGLAWLALAVVQPLALASAGAAILAQGIALLRSPPKQPEGHPWRHWLKASGSALLPAPLLLYLAYAYTRDPVLQAWASQNRLPSPPFWHYLVSYLPVLFLAANGTRQTRAQSAGMRLIAWTLLLMAMAYAPVGVQRRLLEGVWVGMLALATIALGHLERHPTLAAWLSRGVLLLCLPTSLLLLAGGMQAARRPAEPAFRPIAELNAFNWLAENAAPKSVVLSAFQTGNALPAWAPVRVVIGHGPETAGLEQLQPMVQGLFLSTTDNSTRQAFLRDHAVEYVFHGPHERALGTWDPGSAAFLLNVYETSDYVIFHVQQP